MKGARMKDFDYKSGKKYDGMMGRCYRENDPSFKNYGLKGVKVCSEWIKDLNSFRNWIRSELVRIDVSESMFIENSSYYQLDRIDSNGHYSPLNCRICSPQQNARNKSNIKRIITSAEGEEIEL